ncbi:hypothetical protein A1O1_00058 [Capronia coronata CBS 617.96]|uniref:Uncharacterized protein n=1 Tax=Capronia coronata CBS 617.96 TaxID=1182541 RepID=W9YZ41_9EURO|nr:uncharacterized protein A1O1_00058 [Capronia coronata CBS 617.96]EXJ94940.1 hypothetical protein A1O1_00058 [Capronia coronata CBS 617.96]
MSPLFEKLKPSKSDGMSGIGADQGALETSGSPSFNPTKSADQEGDPDLGVGSGDGKGQERAPNTFGGPSFGRTSQTSKHDSELLNKLDPRIGYDGDEVREQDLEQYEKKYGRPEPVPDADSRGVDMVGIGPDQSALREDPTFRSQEQERSY